MEKIKHLVSGEFTRLTKYNLFTASLVVALVWVGIGYFLELEEFKQFLPFVFLMESSAMTSLLVGAEMFYEKKEHTISSMLISPMTETEYLLGKIIANILNILLIFVIIGVSLYFFKDFLFNFHWLFLGIVLVSSYYVFVGVLLSYISKDFTALLMNYMVLMIVLVLPSIFVIIGILPQSMLDFIFWTPTEVTLRLLNASFSTTFDGVQYLMDTIYIVILSFVLYKFFVLPNFKSYATKDLGV
jgi:fluoroquinolone transport system permease protein